MVSSEDVISPDGMYSDVIPENFCFTCERGSKFYVLQEEPDRILKCAVCGSGLIHLKRMEVSGGEAESSGSSAPQEYPLIPRPTR